MYESLGLKNINMLSKEKYSALIAPSSDELWAVETDIYVDDNGNWYRVYPDGWCEQGGLIPASTSTIVNFLKPFRDSLYTIQLTCINKTASDQNWSASVKTATSFTYHNSESYAASWYACGYIAE